MNNMFQLKMRTIFCGFLYSSKKMVNWKNDYYLESLTDKNYSKKACYTIMFCLEF